MSLLNPQLKTVSTPIEKMQKTDKILENMAKNILVSHLDRRLHSTEKNSINHYNNFSPKTPNNRNLNTSKCDGKVLTQKINKLDSCISKRKIYNSVSPKKINDISGRINRNAKDSSRSRLQSVRNDPVIVPKTFSPQRRSFVKSNNVLNVSNSGIYTRFMTNIKKLHSRYSTRWYNVVKDVCVGLGITVRRKLSSVCLPNENNSSAESEVIEIKPKKQKACYRCKNYEEQVLTLSTKILDLDKELHENKEKMTNLSEEIDKIKVDLTELDVVKQKLRDIEERIDKKLSLSSGAISSPPPPPPPIPPPPPPLPSSASSPSVSRTVKATVSRKVEKKNCENSRPVISLNDILNVKLKKTSASFDRTNRASPVGLRNRSYQSRC
ncbi:hypothetical protein QE152_g7188 [Popillia japonica]|uniref:Uncharacterized protein n=1 Tax=Popillia japonica TaxID=7064 RepID=A0AAW1MGN1_POPJA